MLNYRECVRADGILIREMAEFIVLKAVIQKESESRIFGDSHHWVAVASPVDTVWTTKRS